MTRIAYIGPQPSKSVSGVGVFLKDVPQDVPPHKAKSILSFWPGLFAIVLPCPRCFQASPAPQEAPSPVEEAQPDEPEAEAAPEPIKKINRGGRPRKE